MTYQHQHQQPPPAYPPAGRPDPVGAPPAAPKRRGRVALLVAGGLVAVLAVAAGTAYGVSRLVGGGDDGKKLRTAWVLDFPELQRNGLKTYDGQDMFGAWLIGDAVVRAQPDGVIAYRLDDGAQAWGVPAPQATCCARPRRRWPRGGAWWRSVPPTRATRSSGSTLPPARRRGGRRPRRTPDGPVRDRRPGPVGGRRPGGRPQWRERARLRAGRRQTAVADRRRPAAARPRLPPDRRAGRRGPGRRHRALRRRPGALLGLDPATGKARWQQQLPAAQQSDGVLSVDPLVGLPGLNTGTFVARDATGRARATFGNPVDGTRFSDLPVNRSNTVSGPGIRPYLADADTLYLPTGASPVGGKMRQANQVVAIDLATGKRRWVSSGHTDSEVELVRLDEQGVLAWEVGDRRDLAPRLVRIDPATGEVTVVAEAPLSAGTEGSDAKVLERDGTVVLVPWKQVTADAAITVLR
ncbi:PQQ-binding-like beta-propeller repeat protein [Micromonospora sp. BRA006-A]|nr:PQQ-binding-like beta-propeller repeat protein [Micromonospora sp. BRA006-A]